MERKEVAVLMAAGLGTRMRPLTDNIPKPLIKVNGIPMIETVIEGLKRRGVGKLVVVVGYLRESFEYLTEKYPEIELVYNNDYKEINNISSIYSVCDMLVQCNCGVFICEADLYISDADIFNSEYGHSCYFGKMVSGYSNDWVFDVNASGRITRVGRGGNDCFNMVGVSRFEPKDAKILGGCIREMYGKPGYGKMFWDDVVNMNLDKLDMIVHQVRPDQIVEIDNIQELVQVDDSYRRFLH